MNRRRLIREIDLATGVVLLEEYRMNGKLHRDPSEGPAYVCRWDQGYVAREKYYWHGRLHREDGPALIVYNEDATIMIDEQYYRHGLLHRDPKQGPARIERSQDGSLVSVEAYCVNGISYRDPADGPCYLDRYGDGRIEHEFYSTPDEAPLPPKTRRKKSGPGPKL